MSIKVKLIIIMVIVGLFLGTLAVLAATNQTALFDLRTITFLITILFVLFLWLGIVVLRDINERHELEEQLLQSRRIETIGMLTGGIAHDFNNLMTPIIGYSSLILSDLHESSPLNEDLREIKKAGERAILLTQQLLAFSRKQILQVKLTNINDLVKDMEIMIKRLIGEDIEFVTMLDAGLKQIEVDPIQIQQVILNLILNARDAMPRGGKLTIKTDIVILSEQYCQTVPEAWPGKFLRLSVSDTGTGITKVILQRIFEPFFTTKESGKGAGLGLSTVYGIAKQHGGWTNVFSEPGKGSTFNVYIPILTAAEQDQISEQEKSRPTDAAKIGSRILVVEDDEDVQKLTARILKKNGFIVFLAKNAKETWELFIKESKDFDLVFCDIVLPDKNGLELFKELQNSRPDLKVVFTSGYTDEKSHLAFIQQRGFKFIPKPYTPDSLPSAIREALSREKIKM